MTLFEGPPEETAGRDHFYQENFSSIVSCVVAANESVRCLAAGVAQRICHKERVLKALRESHGLDSLSFKSKFWRLRYPLFWFTFDRERCS
jgi:neurofibromin 1